MGIFSTIAGVIKRAFGFGKKEKKEPEQQTLEETRKPKEKAEPIRIEEGEATPLGTESPKVEIPEEEKKKRKEAKKEKDEIEKAEKKARDRTAGIVSIKDLEAEFEKRGISGSITLGNILSLNDMNVAYADVFNEAGVDVEDILTHVEGLKNRFEAEITVMSRGIGLGIVRLQGVLISELMRFKNAIMMKVVSENYPLEKIVRDAVYDERNRINPIGMSIESGRFAGELAITDMEIRYGIS